MKKFLFAFAITCAANGIFAGESQTGQQPQQQPTQTPPQQQGVSPRDVTPPIPIVRELVDSVVKEQKAIILTPEQIETLKGGASAARQAGAYQYPNKFIAKPVARTFYIEPDAIGQPRMLRLSAGVFTTLVFSDTNGNPWLVSATSFDQTLFSDGASGAKDSSRPPTNIVKIQPLQQYSYGNIAVELEGLPTPIIFMLSTGQSDENDVRIDARVTGRNPGAKPQLIAMDRMPDHDTMMGYFLDGVPPQGAVRLQVSGGQAEAWALNGSLYLRSRLSILSPAFMNHVGSADGMHVYKFFSLIPNLLASVNGKTATLFVSGF